MISKLPGSLITALENVEGFRKAEFLEAHEFSRPVVSLRLNPAKNIIPDFADMQKVPWASNGYYLPQRPAFIFDPLLHGGAYYVQEASSMFLEQCLVQHGELSSAARVLDLCAAPGGKSTIIQSLLADGGLLVSNEVIKSRTNILTENITKWGGVNVVVTNNDPRDFARVPGYFDIMVVDAPCSGSGLFRRDPAAINEWSPEAVDLCAQRQQRILADAYPALRTGGLLVYATCSYSQEEDEDICDWLMSQYSLQPLSVTAARDWGIVETESRKGARGYRFFPDRVRGEGFFIACFRKNDTGDAPGRAKPGRRLKQAAKEAVQRTSFLLRDPDAFSIYDHNGDLIAVPREVAGDMVFLADKLYIKKMGITLGRPLPNDVLPAHDVAVSTIVNPELPFVPLQKETALQYLRKEEIQTEGSGRGWSLVTYNGLNLGWIKMLNNRINNYYPKEWRILKSADR